MKQRETATQTRTLGIVTRGLLLPAVFLAAISTANAQTNAAVEERGGPSAPETEPAEPAQTPPAAQATAIPDGFKMGGFTFKPGGRIKLDVIRDFKPIGSEDSFDPRTIPTDGSEGVNSNLIAKETRLSLDMRGPVEGRELRMYVETDFYGTSSVLRLRHAYGSYGGLLAGQTWSTFVDENNFPNTIDFESPMAFPSIRQAQVRWSQKLTANWSWAAALEDNKSSITAPAGVPGKAEFPMPDIAARIRYEGTRGHVNVSGFLGRASFRPTTGEPDTVNLWGMLLSGRIKTGGQDYAYGQITFGDGVGRYRSALTAVPDANGKLQPVGLSAYMGGYEHYWSPIFSSNGVFSVAIAPKKDYYNADFNRQLDYGAINFLYWFLPNRAWAGVEYLYGRREVVSGPTGTANRIQFAVRFNFPS
jgi:DcaP outer membrane protein